MKSFLSDAGKKLNIYRETLPDNINYTLRFRKNKDSFASLWFRTRGCRYSRDGGCVMCDYFISKKVDNDDMFSFFLEGISKLEEEPSLMVLMTSGSFFDEDEVPAVVRKKIYEFLRDNFSETIFVFESHVATITNEIILECLNYFPPERIQVEIGIETSNEWIRKYCLNKFITNQQIIDTVKLLNNYNIATIGNFVLGIPFLTLQENLTYALESVNWAIKNGIMKVSLFPINIKPYTLVHWLNKNGLYEQPSLWLLIDVLRRIRKVFLPRVDINWYQKKIPLENPLYTEKIIGPYTCDQCYDKVVDVLNQYFLGDIDRSNLVGAFDNISCPCKEKYNKSIEQLGEKELFERVYSYYSFINANLLNGTWDDYEIRHHLEMQ